MRLALVPATLLSALALSLPAAAATLDTFTLSGVDTSKNVYSISFSLDASQPYTDLYSNFAFANTPVSINGTVEALTVELFPSTNSDFITIIGTGFYDAFQLNANGSTLFLGGDPASGLPPTFAPGIYTGTSVSACLASITMPRTAVSMLPTLAFFQMPVINSNCGDATSLSITVPSTTSVTPEPSTLALLGSGALGVFGIVRRRFLS